MEWIQAYDPLQSRLAQHARRRGADRAAAGRAGRPRVEGPLGSARRAGRGAAVSIVVYGMPATTALGAAVYGAAYGLFPIGWIVLNAVFLYNLTVAAGQFEIVKASVARLSADRRIQALLVAFSFGAFIEGAAGFGTPVAITAALLIGLGFTPLYSAGLSLIANTAPVAFGAIGTPILTLADVTDIPASMLSAMAGRQLPFVSLIVPAWLVVTMSGWRGLRGVWPAVLVSGGSFAHRPVPVEQLRRPRAGRHRRRAGVARLPRPVLRVVEAAEAWDFPTVAAIARVERRAPGRTARQARVAAGRSGADRRAAIVAAWMPWVFLSVFVTAWGTGTVKAFLNGGPAGAASYLRPDAHPRRIPCCRRHSTCRAASDGVPRLSRS